MNSDSLFQILVAGWICATGGYILARRGKFTAWWMSLLVWFALAPIPLSQCHAFLRKTENQGNFTLFSWSLVLLPYVLTTILLLVFFFMRRQRADGDATSSPSYE